MRKRIDDGIDRLEAALATPRTLAVPLLTSSLTTVIAFLPLVLISDSTGEFLRSLGQVLALALIGSWLLAISVTPALCYWFLSDSTVGRATVSRENVFYRLYRGLLSFVLRTRIIFVFLMVGLLFAAGHAFQYVKQRSLGSSARSQFTIYLDLPAVSHISETIAAAGALSAFLGETSANPEVTEVLSYVGAGGPRFFLTLKPNDPQPNKAFLVVNTQESAQLALVMPRVERFLKRELPQATGRTETLFLGSSALGTVELQVRGPDVDTLRQLGEQVRQAFYSVPGIESVRSDWENSVLKIRVEVDQERARRGRGNEH